MLPKQELVLVPGKHSHEFPCDKECQLGGQWQWRLEQVNLTDTIVSPNDRLLMWTHYADVTEPLAANRQYRLVKRHARLVVPVPLWLWRWLSRFIR